MPKDTLVKCAISFGLPGQLLVTNGCPIERDSHALLILQCFLQTGFRGFRLFDGIAQNGRLRQHSLTELLFRVGKRSLGGDHFRMFVLVSQRVSGNRSFYLHNGSPRLGYHGSGGDTRNLEQGVDVIAALLDLLELAFKMNSVGFCCGQFVVQVLQFVFYKAAARSAATRARSLL